MLLLFAVSLSLLILFTALVIDGGVIYVTRAQLSKAADAASLAGIVNLSQGRPQAAQLARDMFAANYVAGSHDAKPPFVQVDFATDASNNTVLDVTGTAFVDTYFLGILPEFDVFPVSATSEALRAKLVMSIVLDRSGSMVSNQGCVALAPAVDTFIDFFDDVQDSVSLTTFASDSTLKVKIKKKFNAAVKKNTPRNCNLEFGGFTFFDGGLNQALLENESVVIQPGEEVVKVVVFFTDGLANTFQESVSCPPNTVVNVTSGDSGNGVTLIDPATGKEICRATPSGGPFPCCPGFVQFPSVLGGSLQAVGVNAGFNVRLEAKNRALSSGVALRKLGNTVYTIGLGNNVDQAFMKKVANDPSSPSYDPSQPTGEFAFAPTAKDLEDVFERIARKILVRISQ